MSKRRIVVTGIGVIAPNGIGKEQFWQSLREGSSGIKPITIFDPTFFKSKLAGEVTNFDAESFLEAKGLRNLDESTKFLCAAAKMALEDANIEITEENTDDIGVVTATTLSALWDIVRFSREIEKEGPQFASPVAFPGTTINAPSSQVSIRYNIKGFNTTVSTGYTASLDALNYAVDFIRLGRAKAVLVGGVEALSFESYVGFYKLGFLAGIEGEEVSCPFDRRRNGIILGEGAGVLLIEAEDHARNRDTKIYAEIRSVESCFDAYRSGKYQPRAEGLRTAISKALRNSGLNKTDIHYISAAANSTKQQDKLETEAIQEVFQEYAGKIPVTAIKSMTGETFSAAGLLQIIAAIGTMQRGFIPPTINYTVKDKDCALDYVPDGSRKANIDNVLVNNFGPGGGNTVAVMSKYKGGW
jgi:3-oxoacyl-[acyl-carrier-protein] synthase II